MKRSLLFGIVGIGLLIGIGSCNPSRTKTIVSESDNVMTIVVEDNTVTPSIDFTGHYDITGMDSVQRKALSKRVLDSLGHGNYK